MWFKKILPVKRVKDVVKWSFSFKAEFIYHNISIIGYYIVLIVQIFQLRYHMIATCMGGCFLVGKWLWTRHSMWSDPLLSRDFELEKIRELPCIFLSSHFSRDLKALSTLKLLSKILYIQLYILFSVQHTNPNRPGWICISHKIWKICSIIYEESYCMIHTDIDSNTFSILWRYYQSLIS